MTADKDLGERGWTVIEGVFDENECAKLADTCVYDIVGGIRTSVQAPDARAHVALPLSPPVAAMITRVVAQFPDLENTVRGRQHITELAALYVFPGAREQPVHMAHVMPDKVSYTFFVNLAATSPESGVFKAAREGISVLEVRNGRLLPRDTLGPGDLVELPAGLGSILAFNAQCPHQGGRNSTRNHIRPALYFSIGDPGVGGVVYPIHPFNVSLRLNHFRPITEERTAFIIHGVSIHSLLGRMEIVQFLYHGVPFLTVEIEDELEMKLLIALNNSPGIAIGDLADNIGAPQEMVLDYVNQLMQAGVLLSHDPLEPPPQQAPISEYEM